MTIVNSNKLGLDHMEILIQVGPYKITLFDTWTTLAPGVLPRETVRNLESNKHTKDFEEGWLADIVSI